MLNALLSAALLSCLPSGEDPAAARPAVAKLSIAIGTIETKTTAEEDYKAIAAGSGIEANTWVRTAAKSKAAFEFPDGTELRVNENSEILIGGSRQVELKLGQIFIVAVRGASTFQLKTPFSDMSFDQPATLDVSFVHRDPNSPEAKRVSKTVTQLCVLDGVITTPSKRYTQQVTTGYMCTLVDGQLNTPNSMGDPSVSSLWVHEILLKRGKMTPEVETRYKTLIQMLGRYGEHQDLSDIGIRGLGELTAPFLAEYLKFPPSPQETTRRRAAVRIISDVGTKAQIPDLVAALKDPDADTRAAAAKGLERLAGTTLKFDEAYWRGVTPAAGQKAWEEWLQKNPPKK